MTMGTFDTLLLAFDMDGRVDEAESFWNMILHTHTRSISKRLFSRMIILYDHHNHPDKVIEVYEKSYLVFMILLQKRCSIQYIASMQVTINYWRICAAQLH